MLREAIVIVLGTVLLALAGGCDEPATTPAKRPTDAVGDPAIAKGSPTVAAAQKPVKVHDDAHLPNVFKVHDRVFSGGQPDGDDAFRTLASLGVKTVISVDGAKPDVALAGKHGLRYVHLPHGYDGVPEDRAEELAKAVREFDGPVYIHCHHGKHRSPAAAAVACVSAGLIAPASALAILKAAGTNKNYRGLYSSAEDARPIDPQLLDALEVDFPEVAELPPLAEAMVNIEVRYDHLMQLAANGWQPLANHPDLAPPHEALLLREHFTELLRTEEVRRQPADFRRLLAEGKGRAEALEDELAEWDAAKPDRNLGQLTPAFEAVNQNCTACHTQFRDVPLDEKGRR